MQKQGRLYKFRRRCTQRQYIFASRHYIALRSGSRLIRPSPRASIQNLSGSIETNSILVVDLYRLHVAKRIGS
jgi:hypothetical protein